MLNSKMNAVEKGQRHISFHFHPYKFDAKDHAIEKADSGGVRRRYLKGVSSGLKTDAHGERMTQDAVGSFMEQANSGDILLYADVHGIKFTEDIGILNSAEVMKNGDWLTEYRLYDEQDGVDTFSVQRADKLWKQCVGLPPYKHPKQKGFSIEGYLPDDDGGVEMDASGKQLINDVTLDGVVVVPRPAYQDSIAHAVYKALGIDAPWTQDGTVASRIRQVINEDEDRDNYYRMNMQLDDAVRQLVLEAFAVAGDNDMRPRLEEIYEEYKGLMVDLIMRNPTMFSADEISLDRGPVEVKVAKSNLFKGLLASLNDLGEVYGGDTE